MFFESVKYYIEIYFPACNNYVSTIIYFLLFTNGRDATFHVILFLRAALTCPYPRPLTAVNLCCSSECSKNDALGKVMYCRYCYSFNYILFGTILVINDFFLNF